MKSFNITVAYSELSDLIELVTSCIADRRRISVTRVGFLFSASCPKCSTEFRTGPLRMQTAFSGMPARLGVPSLSGCSKCRDQKIFIRVYRVFPDELQAFTNHRLFQRLSAQTKFTLRSHEIPDPPDRDAINQFLQEQIEKSKNHGISVKMADLCASLWLALSEEVCCRLLIFGGNQVFHHKFEDFGQTGIYMVATLFPWSTEHVVKELAGPSPEAVNYTRIWTQLFMNEWPEGHDAFFHVIFCKDKDDFRIHTSLGGNPNEGKEKIVLPIELLNPDELRRTGLAR